MSEEPKYTEGICGDGAAILKDGERMTISEIIAELNIRPDSKPEKDCKSFCKLFSEAKLRDDFYLEKCRLCKESPDSKPYKYAEHSDWWAVFGKIFDFDEEEEESSRSFFNAARELKEKP